MEDYPNDKGMKLRTNQQQQIQAQQLNQASYAKSGSGLVTNNVTSSASPAVSTSMKPTQMHVGTRSSSSSMMMVSQTQSKQQESSSTPSSSQAVTMHTLLLRKQQHLHQQNNHRGGSNDGSFGTRERDRGGGKKEKGAGLAEQAVSLGGTQQISGLLGKIRSGNNDSQSLQLYQSQGVMPATTKNQQGVKVDLLAKFATLLKQKKEENSAKAQAEVVYSSNGKEKSLLNTKSSLAQQVGLQKSGGSQKLAIEVGHKKIGQNNQQRMIVVNKGKIIESKKNFNSQNHDAIQKPTSYLTKNTSKGKLFESKQSIGGTQVTLLNNYTSPQTYLATKSASKLEIRDGVNYRGSHHGGVPRASSNTPGVASSITRKRKQKNNQAVASRHVPSSLNSKILASEQSSQDLHRVTLDSHTQNHLASTFPQRGNSIDANKNIFALSNKKKKKQPSQQASIQQTGSSSVSGIDRAVEEQLAYIARLQDQQVQVYNSTQSSIAPSRRRSPSNDAQKVAAMTNIPSSSTAKSNHPKTSSSIQQQQKQCMDELVAQFRLKCQEEMDKLQAAIQVQETPSLHSTFLVSKGEQPQAPLQDLLAQRLETMQDLITHVQQKVQSDCVDAEFVENRIHTVLTQVQQVLGEVEDSINGRLDGVGEEFAKLGEKIGESQGVAVEQAQILGKHNEELQSMRTKLETLARDMQSYKIQHKKEMDKISLNEDTISELVRDQVKGQLSKVVVSKDMVKQIILEERAAMMEEVSLILLTESNEQKKVIEEEIVRYSEELKVEMRKDIKKMVSDSMTQVSDAFKSQIVLVREEMQQLLSRELQAKEVNIQNKMEQSKQDFLKAVNNNMKVLDTLISDYTTRTQQQIRKQFDGKSSSSNKFKKSMNGDSGVDDIHSQYGCSATENLLLEKFKSKLRLDQKSGGNQDKQSSIQDLSDPRPAITDRQEDSSSLQLASTDRQHLAEMNISLPEEERDSHRNLIKIESKDKHEIMEPEQNEESKHQRQIQTSLTEHLEGKKKNLQGQKLTEGKLRPSAVPQLKINQLQSPLKNDEIPLLSPIDQDHDGERNFQSSPQHWNASASSNKRQNVCKRPIYEPIPDHLRSKPVLKDDVRLRIDSDQILEVRPQRQQAADENQPSNDQSEERPPSTDEDNNDEEDQQQRFDSDHQLSTDQFLETDSNGILFEPKDAIPVRKLGNSDAHVKAQQRTQTKETGEFPKDVQFIRYQEVLEGELQDKSFDYSNKHIVQLKVQEERSQESGIFRSGSNSSLNSSQCQNLILQQHPVILSGQFIESRQREQQQQLSGQDSSPKSQSFFPQPYRKKDLIKTDEDLFEDLSSNASPMIVVAQNITNPTVPEESKSLNNYGQGLLNSSECDEFTTNQQNIWQNNYIDVMQAYNSGNNYQSNNESMKNLNELVQKLNNMSMIKKASQLTSNTAQAFGEREQLEDFIDIVVQRRRTDGQRDADQNRTATTPNRNDGEQKLIKSALTPSVGTRFNWDLTNPNINQNITISALSGVDKKAQPQNQTQYAWLPSLSASQYTATTPIQEIIIPSSPVQIPNDPTRKDSRQELTINIEKNLNMSSSELYQLTQDEIRDDSCKAGKEREGSPQMHEHRIGQDSSSNTMQIRFVADQNHHLVVADTTGKSFTNTSEEDSILQAEDHHDDSCSPSQIDRKYRMHSELTSVRTNPDGNGTDASNGLLSRDKDSRMLLEAAKQYLLKQSPILIVQGSNNNKDNNSTNQGINSLNGDKNVNSHEIMVKGDTEQADHGDGNLPPVFMPEGNQNSHTPSPSEQLMPGSNLPSSLQKQGNEIASELIFDEVMEALDHILSLNRDNYQ